MSDRERDRPASARSPDPEEAPAGLGELLARVLQGDQGAYEELLGQLRPLLINRMRMILGPDYGGLDRSNIVQSVLRRIHAHFDDLRADDPTETHLQAWITRILKNRIIDELRRRARDPMVPGGPDVAQVPDRREDPAEREQRLAALVRALAALPERQRQVVELHWFDGLSDAEISTRLGGSVAALRVLRCRALKALRRLLGEQL
jgi:RNA polymerase sigma-70 factor (ECF subfamily)